MKNAQLATMGVGLAKFCPGGGCLLDPLVNKLCLSLFFFFFGGGGLYKKQNLISPVACLWNPFFGRPKRGGVIPPSLPTYVPQPLFFAGICIKWWAGKGEGEEVKFP